MIGQFEYLPPDVARERMAHSEPVKLELRLGQASEIERIVSSYWKGASQSNLRAVKPRIFGTEDEADSGDAFIGLRSLLERIHDVAPVEFAKRAGVDIATPFGHVALVGDFASVIDKRYRENIAQMLEDEIWREFGRYVDPRIGVRVRFFDMPRRQEGAMDAAMIGRGVFLPGGFDESDWRDGQIGKLELRNTAGGMPRQAELPNQLPAAFYAGQRGVAFSDHRNASGQVRTLAGLPPGVIRDVEREELFGSKYFIGRPTEVEDVVFQAKSGAPGAPPAKYSLVDPDAPSSPPIAENEALTPEQWYRVVRIAYTSKGRPIDELFDFRYLPDGALEGRLRHDRPLQNCLALHRLRLPSPSAHDRISRLWIDVDKDGRLVRHDLSRRAYSIVLHRHDRRIALYDRTRAPAGFTQVYNIGDGAEAQFDLPGARICARAHEDQFVEIYPASDAPFGYVSLERAMEQWATLTTGPERGETSISLSWIDQAGMIDVGNSNMLGEDADAEPMAVRLVKRRYQSLTSFLAPAPQQIWIYRQSPALQLNGGEPVQPGGTFEYGPFIFKYLAGTGL
ncbi:MAG: hypothetical protein MRY74_16955 [Neomegalonema sp.]|nr:hypothetical protein [Neomegalonema sp.]